MREWDLRKSHLACLSSLFSARHGVYGGCSLEWEVTSCQESPHLENTPCFQQAECPFSLLLLGVYKELREPTLKCGSKVTGAQGSLVPIQNSPPLLILCPLNDCALELTEEASSLKETELGQSQDFQGFQMASDGKGKRPRMRGTWLFR